MCSWLPAIVAGVTSSAALSRTPLLRAVANQRLVIPHHRYDWIKHLWGGSTAVGRGETSSNLHRAVEASIARLREAADSLLQRKAKSYALREHAVLSYHHVGVPSSLSSHCSRARPMSKSGAGDCVRSAAEGWRPDFARSTSRFLHMIGGGR